MSGDKLIHYYPDAQFNWTSEGDWGALEWFGPGEKPDEDEFSELEWPIEPVPSSVTRRQAKRALLAAGLLDDAEAAIAAAGAAAQIDWADALEFRRDNPLIAAMGIALSLSSEQIDDLFRAAALIE